MSGTGALTSFNSRMLHQSFAQSVDVQHGRETSQPLN